MTSSEESDFTSDDSGAFTINTDPICNWCSFQGKLVKNKPYCQNCLDKSFHECIRCKRPFPHAKYFELNSERCNSCHKKYLKEKKKTNKSNGNDQAASVSGIADQPSAIITKITKRPAEKTVTSTSTTSVKKPRGRPAGSRATKNPPTTVGQGPSSTNPTQPPMLCNCDHAIRARFLSSQPFELGFMDRKVGFIPIFM